MLYKFKDKYFILNVVSIILFGLIFVSLIKLQIIDSEEYFEKSKSYLSSTDIIPAPRGKILDRYGRPIVSNRLGFSVSFNKATVSDDELNDLILNSIKLFKKNDDEYVDTFPIQYSEDKYIFAYNDLTDDALETKVRNCKFTLGISDNLDAEGCIKTLIDKFGLDNRYTKSEIRDIIAIRYEMLLRKFSDSTPFTLSSDVSIKTVSAIEENDVLYDGIKVSNSPVRKYIHQNLASHILGRVGIIFREEYEALKDEGYGLNSLIGKDGIEKILEKQIKGKDGYRSVSQTINSDSQIKEVAAVPGNNAMLTIDIDIQKTAERALMETIESIKANSWKNNENAGNDVGGGAVVVQDVESGEILAMASYPDFNPDNFTKDYDELSKNESNPLLNRAISGIYPPGSVFKMLTTIAALEEGVVSPSSVIEDEGVYNYYDQEFNCWIYTESGETHGPMDASNALKNSCNYYYYEVGKRLGVEKLVNYGNLFRLGQKTGIELEGEAEGVLASEEYKRLKFDEVWYPGDTLQMAIGQSFNLFTPLQLAGYTATIANKGFIYQPHIIKCVRNSETGAVVSETTPKTVNTIKMDESTHDAVTMGMRLVSYDGTASSVFGDFPIETCSKTGSSQISGGSANGVFVTYAPYNNPKIAISVVVESAGSGSVTAPIAKAIYSEYFKLNPKQAKDSHILNNTLVS